MRWTGFVVIWVTAIWILSSRLAFVPVPWPDGPAFLFPGLDLLSWPPQWRMHSQAAFVPSYDIVSYNIPPGLCILLGLGSRLGLTQIMDPLLATRALTLLGLLGFAWFLWRWLLKSVHWFPATLVGLAALWDPIIRWGTMAVRTEIWVGIIWILILKELSEKRSLWKISLYLGLGAYIHYDAVILVPGVAIALWDRDLRVWWQKLLGVGWRTALILSPWFIYFLVHFPIFLEQMGIQFGRLDKPNIWVANAYLWFHSLFMDLGSPNGWPKYFNVAKGLFWLTAASLTLGSLWGFRRKKNSPLLLGAGVTFLASLYLWRTKPEVWFTVLCHATLWAWVGAWLVSGQWVRTLSILSGGYAVLALAASVHQMKSIPDYYSWTNYHAWRDCIEKVIYENPEKPRTRVWQPGLPDILIELRVRHPELDLTRSLDFDDRIELAWENRKNLDVIILSRYSNLPSGTPIPAYNGPEREADRKKMEDGIGVVFGPLALERLPKDPPGTWKMQVCEYGPFWANLASKR